MHLSAWMGAGVLAAGVSAALVAGADVASADTGTDTTSSSPSSDDSASSSTGSDDRANETSSDADTNTDTDGGADTDVADDGAEDDTDAEDADGETDVDDSSEEDAAEDEADGGVATGGSDNSTDEQSDDTEIADEESEAEPEPVRVDEDVDTATDAEVIVEDTPSQEPAETPAPVVDADDTDTDTATAVTLAGAKNATSAATTFASASRQPTLLEAISSVIFDVVGVAVTFIAGPPVVPHGSTVTVRQSSLEITDGRKVPAHWYYPEGDEPPQRIIYLQHGFLGVGAMYSYTAANLAESTNSIVVVPTLTSNRYVSDGFWLGSDQALRATAALFEGDREALTASAIAAGFAKRYGTEAVLPGRFALVGHSLGGNLVAGTAGYYADAVNAGGTENQLAGVILLDAAPQGSVLSDALDKLDSLDTYIPVIELGAPKEARRVDAALNSHRPGKFNGVVLANGEHLDSMEGGTWLIQFISHLYQGFPTAQNQAAAQILIDGWAADILDGRIDPTTGRCDGQDCAGIYGGPGQVLELDTPAGPTSGTVIGVPAPARSAVFEPWAATATVAPRPPRGSGLLLTL